MLVTRYKDAKPYEAPEHPEIRLESAKLSPDRAVEVLLDYLSERGMTRPPTIEGA